MQTTVGAVDERLGRAFVVTSVPDGDGDFDRDLVSVLDTQGGRLLRQVPLAIAVDEGAGRMHVANGSDRTISVLDAAHP